MNITTVAVSGRAAPGAEPAARFGLFREPILGPDGTVTFGASLTGVGSASDSGLWVGAPGSLQLVAREGQAAPGLPAGAKYDDFVLSFTPVLLNANGQIAFSASITGGGTFGHAIWEGTPRDLRLVARDLTQAADSAPSENYLSIQTPDLNDSGRITFDSVLSVPGDTRRLEGIFTGPPDALVRASRSADPAVGTPEKFIVFGLPKLSNSGQTLFTARILDLGARGDHGIWVTNAEAPRLPLLVARESNPTPGMDPSIKLGDILIRQVQFNHAGQVLFQAALQGNVTTANDSALFTGTTRSLHPLVRASDAAPGLAAAATFDNFDSSAFLHDGGRFTFGAQLRSVAAPAAPTVASIWTGRDGSFQPIALQGDAAPGTSQPFYLFGGVPVVNADGEVAFIASLGVDTDATHRNGIWLGQPGDLHLVAEEGKPFDLGGGEVKTVSRLDLVLRDEQLRYVLNDDGQLRFLANFTDGTSGLFIAAVPEPAAAGCFTVALFPLLRRRRRA